MLSRTLSNRDLKSISTVPLTESLVLTTLQTLMDSGKIKFNHQKNTISAKNNNDKNTHITIHTHDTSDTAWNKRLEIFRDFVEFVGKCDSIMKEAIDNVGSKK